MRTKGEQGLGDWLTPPALAGRVEDATRARAFSATCLVAAPLATSFASLRWAAGLPVAAAVQLAGAAGFVGAAFHLQRTGELPRSIHVASFVSLALMAHAILLGGSAAGSAVAWYGMVPVAASVGLPQRSALAWTAAVVALPPSLFCADHIGWLAQAAFADGAQMMESTLFVGGLGTLTRVYDRLADDARRDRDAAVRALEAERQRTADLTGAQHRFVKTVSHELRTPLNHILGATQLLGHTPLDEEQRDLVSMAEASGADLLDLIDGAIAAQAAEGDLHIASEPIHLEVLLSRVSRGYASRARAQGLDLVVELDSSLPERALGDPRRIEQVLSALLENALAFTSEGSIYLRVIDRGRGRVRFEVEDTGVGIDPKDFERIFEPFRQLDESDSRRHGGLGAGLAVCRRLARLMGGDVTVQSGLGRGSVFSFDVHLGLERPTSTGDVAPQGEPARPRAARVLLADANPRTRAGSIGTLEQMGLRAQGVDDQAQLAESLDSGRFDVVLVDLDLPGDRPLASTLAERDLGSAYLVALATLEPGRAPSPPEGFHDLLPKPLRREQIVEILRKWSNTGPTSAPEAPPARPRA